jgi:uncharacterized protein YjiS (DUF1127 family)
MSSTGGISAPDQQELGIQEALIIGAGIIGLLIFLVIIRFGCNIALDVCILGEPGRAKRSIAELWRKICPWWRRRTQPEILESENNVEMPDVAIITEEERSVILDSILKSREVTADDMKLWKEKHHRTEASEGHSDEEEASRSSNAFGFECSICIHELNEGSMAFTAACGHVYHRKCIHQWVNSRRTDCPNCRTEIVPLDKLEYALDQGSTTSL